MKQLLKRAGIMNIQLCNLLDKLIAIDLSKQTELGNLDLKQQINFIGSHDEGQTTMFFVIEKS